nr:ABC transporter, permease component [uncultured bacterium]
MVLLVLALCIGANTAIFSVVNAILFRPLPYDNPERLVRVWATDYSHGYPKSRMSLPDVIDLRDQSETMEGVAAFFDLTATLGGDDPQHIRVEAVSPSYLSLLGVKPQTGRLFSPDEDQQGKNRVAILTHNLWQRRFNSDPAIIDQSITLDGVPYTVVGILPAGFKSVIPGLEGEPDVWRPLATQITPQSRGLHFLMVIGRVKEGVSLDRAQAEVSTIASRLEQEYPASNTGFGIALEPLKQAVVSDTRAALLVLFGAVFLVLLIGCGNIANLLLARAIERQKELAIRAALGASRGRLIRIILTESAVLAFAGAVFGVLLAYWGIKVILSFSPGNIPRLDEVGIDGLTLAFTFGISLLTSLICGLAPALYLTKVNLNDMLKETGRSATASASGRRFRNGLVVSQVGLTLVLLIGAGLMLKSFYRLLNVDPGFSSDKISTMRVSLPRAVYTDPAKSMALFERLVENSRALPEVETVGAVDFLPMSRPPSCNSFTIVGQPPPQPGSGPCTEMRVVTPDYLASVGIPMISGRPLSEHDTDKTTLVALINDAARKKFWPSENPLGQRVTVGNQTFEIVGLVGDVKNFGLDSEATPEMYFALRQSPVSSMYLVVRSSADPKTVAEGVQRELHSLDKGVPIYSVKTMEQYISESVSPRRFNMLLLGIFASLALILAAVGIYGLISYSVSQRSQEIGLRLAVGAQRGDILKLIVGHSLKLTGAGIAIGVIGAIGLAGLMTKLLFSVTVFDVPILVGTSVLLTVVSLVSSFVPAFRATRVDPLIALRQQ